MGLYLYSIKLFLMAIHQLLVSPYMVEYVEATQQADRQVARYKFRYKQPIVEMFINFEVINN